MKKLICLIVVVLFLSLSFTPGIVANEPTLQKTIYVDDDNTMGPWDGTQEHPYLYIQDGINNAIDGDTVFVYSGTYYENPTVYKRITLYGENKNTTIIDGRGEDNVLQISWNAYESTVTGFTIQNSSMWNRAGIVVSSDSVLISQNIIKSNAVGIDLKGQTCTIKENKITENSEKGIHVRANSNSIIMNDITNNSFAGIVLLGETVHDVLISENNIINHRDGIWISGLYETYYIDICKNVIANSSKAGIALYGSTESLIMGNIFEYNNDGIMIVLAENDVIKENIFSNNKQGVAVWGSTNNRINRNNFINNEKHAFFSHLIFPYIKSKNNWNRNYWDNHHLPLPKPILGQKLIVLPPLVINLSWVKFDWLPALKPYDITAGGT